MIGIALLIGASLLVGSTLLVKYWNKVIEFMKKVINKLEVKLDVNQKLMGAAIYIRKVGDKIQNKTKHYSKNEVGKWKETIVTYEQDVNEIPEEYRKYASETEDYDLTPELELQLNEA